MLDSRQHDRRDELPESPVSGPTRGDRIAAAALLGGFCALCAAAVAWMMEMTPAGMILFGLAGALAGAAIGSYRPLLAAGSASTQAFRQATEDFEGPARDGEAIRRALGGQRGLLAWRLASWAISGALVGALFGGMYSRRGGMPWAPMLGALLGVAVGIGLGLLIWTVTTASTVLLVRKTGLPVGYAILGGAIGAMWGMELWYRWWHIPWPNLGALALGLPMAVLVALLGRQRSRLKRKPVGKPRDSELG